MSRPVGVLAVMDAAIEGIGGPTDLGLTEARAAVAELVEAAKRASLMLSVAGPMCGIHALNETVFYDEAECDGACVHDDCANAAESLTAALAKFGGAA